MSEVCRFYTKDKRSFELKTNNMGWLRSAVLRAFGLSDSMVVIECDTAEDAERAARKLRNEYKRGVSWLVAAQRGCRVYVVDIDNDATVIRWQNVEG